MWKGRRVNQTIEGIFVPSAVPFDESGRINEHELRRLTNWLIEKGVSGLYPNGSTGEFIRLSFEERLNLVKIMAEETQGRVPILAGAAENNIETILKACRAYADMGCRAISLTPPYYYGVSQESVEQYFRIVAQQSPIDIIAYNIPQFANEISLPVLSRLALDCPRIVGTKDSSKDFPRMLHTINQIKAQRPDFVILTGSEETLYPALQMGANGGTIATCGVAPEAIMKLYQDFRAGNHESCKAIQFKLLDVMAIMLGTPNFPDGFRQGYELRGFRMGKSRHPVSPDEERHLREIHSRIACLLAECGYPEAAAHCRQNGQSPEGEISREMVESITHAVVESLRKNS